MRIAPALGLLLLAGCGGDDSGAPATALAATNVAAKAATPVAGDPAADIVAEIAIAQGRCLACHAADAATTARLTPFAAPPLSGIGARRSAGYLQEFVAGHHAGDAAMAADLVAFLRRPEASAPLRPAIADAAMLARGEQLFRQSACSACHTREGILGLGRRTDHASTVALLRDSRAVRPDLLAHDFALELRDASAIAAWLLRSQRQKEDQAPPAPGIAWECFELNIADASLPELDGREPKARGHAETIDLAVRTRDNHFALRFRGELQVPQDGEYTFVGGADDCVWIWVDDQLVVRNEAIAPYRRREGKLQLTAGAHALRVVYTEAAGGEQLDVLWRGPGFDLQPIPTGALRARTTMLVPPADPGPPDPAAVERGRSAFAARSCGACHAGDGLPAPQPPAKPWAELPEAVCARVTDPLVPKYLNRVRAVLQRPRQPAGELLLHLRRDGCLSCHVRDKTGGLADTLRGDLVEVEDLGDEGRLPPDLTKVGHRLRQDWMLALLRDGRRARAYLRVRMPKVAPLQAQRYAELFAQIDAEPGDDQEPPFAATAVEQGRIAAGSTGRGCIACHDVGENAAVGPRGMDLLLQHERLRPRWFREWLLAPLKHRPGTRMPSFWPQADERALAEIDALRVWSSLGAAAPLPDGLRRRDQPLLLAADEDGRPRLHGAFLHGLSARCLAVGTKERTHYAYDLAQARLAWLWRGAFLDAGGTWSGRAGELLQPLGTDWVVLEDLPLRSRGGEDPAARQVLGQRRAADGHPVFRWRIGAAEVEDEARPRLVPGGSELVRTLRCVRGTLVVPLRHENGTARLFVDGKPANGDRELAAGASLEIVYRW